MRPDETQPGAAAAITASSSPALPAAGGDTSVDTEVGVTSREEEENTMPASHQVSPHLISPPREEVDAVALGNSGPLFAVFKEVAENAVGDPTGVEVSAKCRELRSKLSKKLELRREWAGFENPSEEQKFTDCEEAISADQEFLIEQTYQAMLDDVKKMEKMIKIRVNEFKNRDASLKSLNDCIVKLSFLQAELHKDECLKAQSLAEKVEQQREMKMYEDPIVLCRELDSLRKKIEKPCCLPIKFFSSTTVEDLIFNAERNDFKSFVGQLQNRLFDNDQYEKIKKSYLLPLQTIGEQPPKWLRICLLGRGKDKVFIYLRSDNGSFVAFENKNGKFELGPRQRSTSSRLIPESKFVDCDTDYTSMMNFERLEHAISYDDLRKRLKALKLNVEAMLEDIHTLSVYSHPPPYGAIQRFQIALARITIMICEVCKIIQLVSAVGDGWISGAQLNELLLQYILNWKLVSKAFRAWRTDKSRKFSLKLQRLVKMLYAEEAADVLFLVLNGMFGDGSDDEPEEDQPGNGGDDEPEDQPGDGGDDEPEKDPGDGGDDEPEEDQPGNGGDGEPEVQPGDGGDGEPEVQPGDGGNDESEVQPGDGGNDESEVQPGDGGKPAEESNNTQQPPQGSSQQQPHQGSAAPRDGTDTSQQQAPHLRPHAAAGNEDATCCGSSSTSIRISKHYSVHWPSQGLIDFVPYFKKPMADYCGSEPRLSLAGQTLDEMSEISEIFDNFPFVGTMLCDWQLRHSSVCSPSRGLIDLIYINNRRSSPLTMASLTGQSLVEIFEVSANFPFVGTIMVCDERSSKTLYCREDWDQAYCDFVSRRNKWISSSGNAAVHFKDKIELTGPSRATTADSGFVIKACIPKTRMKASEVCKLSFNSDDSSLYNEPKTYTMKTDRGCLHVTCSVLPEALQAFVDVTLQLPSQWRGVMSAKVYGSITARIDKFDIGSTLFNKDVKEAVPLNEGSIDEIYSGNPDRFFPSQQKGYKIMRVPLARSILAVPLGEALHIKGTLQVCGYDAVPITINHCIHINHENVYTRWMKCGESLNAVRMWLRPIF